ncbi:MAG: hypothetical protein PVI86_06845, partial [Phycisphaerae bacterium]
MFSNRLKRIEAWGTEQSARRTRAAALTIATVVLCLCIGRPVQAGPKRPDDAQITKAIEREMWGDD